MIDAGPSLSLLRTLRCDSQLTHSAPIAVGLQILVFQIFSAAELAGQAAVQRLTPEEQEVEDCCGHTEGNKGATAAATAATPAAAATPPTAADAGSGGASGSTGPVEERRSAEAAVASLVSEMSVASDNGADGGVAVGLTAPPLIGGSRNSSSGSAGALQESEAGERRQNLTAMDVPEDADAPPPAPQAWVSTAPAALLPEADNPPSPTPRSSTPLPSPPAPLSAAAPAAAAPAAAISVSHSPPPLDELLAMGFPREAAVEALAASSGSIPDAAHRLLTPGMMASNGAEGSAATVAAATSGGGAGSNQAAGGGGIGGGSGEEVRLPRDVRLQHAADRIGGHADRARAVQVMISLGDTTVRWWKRVLGRFG